MKSAYQPPERVWIDPEDGRSHIWAEGDYFKNIGWVEYVRAVPSPHPHPSMNPGSFGDGRGVYEVEEELLALQARLSPSKLKRLFQSEQWRLWWMGHKYWPTTLKSVQKDRTEYSNHSG